MHWLITFKDNNIQWNFNTMNDINDLIHILFNIIHNIPFLNHTKRNQCQ